MSVQVSDLAALDYLRTQASRLAVYVKSDSCGPCHGARPRVRAAFVSDERWVLVEVDAQEAPEVVGQMLALVVPTLVLYVGGQEVERLSRIIPQRRLVEIKEQADGLAARFDL